jgi:hypothetical protein
MKQNLMIAVGVIVTALVIGMIKMAIQESASAEDGQTQTVEQVAADVVKRHNDADLTDDMTVSSTAEARGKQIIFRNVLRVQKDLSAEKLNEFRTALREEIVPKTCMVNADNVAFMKMGMYYTFIYLNTYGQKLAEFNVDRAAYDQWKASR